MRSQGGSCPGLQSLVSWTMHRPPLDMVRLAVLQKCCTKQSSELRSDTQLCKGSQQLSPCFLAKFCINVDTPAKNVRRSNGGGAVRSPSRYPVKFLTRVMKPGSAQAEACNTWRSHGQATGLPRQDMFSLCPAINPRQTIRIVDRRAKLCKD